MEKLKKLIQKRSPVGLPFIVCLICLEEHLDISEGIELSFLEIK